MNDHLLAKLLKEGEDEPSKLFHVEMLLKGSHGRLIMDIDGDALGRLTHAFSVGADHPLEMTDHSGAKDPRSVMVDPLEIACIFSMNHRPKSAREK